MKDFKLEITRKHVVLTNALYRALSKQDIETVRTLVTQDPSLLHTPAAYAYGLPIYPLSAALQMGNDESVLLLLEQGITTEPDSIIPDYAQETSPLELAIRTEKSTQLIMALFDALFSKIVPQKALYYLLRYLFQSERRDCIFLLLEQPSYRNMLFADFTIFKECIVIALDMEIDLVRLISHLETLPNKQWLTKVPNEEMNLLRYCVNKNELSAVRALLDLGISAVDGGPVVQDFSAAFLAIHRHHYDILKLLLARGANQGQLFAGNDAQEVYSLETFAILAKSNEALLLLKSHKPQGVIPPYTGKGHIYLPVEAALQACNEELIIAYMPDSLDYEIDFFKVQHSNFPLRLLNQIRFAFFAIGHNLQKLLAVSLQQMDLLACIKQGNEPLQQLFVACCRFANENAWLLLCEKLGKETCVNAVSLESFQLGLRLVEQLFIPEKIERTARIVASLFPKFISEIDCSWAAIATNMTLYQLYKESLMTLPAEKKLKMFTTILTSACAEGSWAVIDDILRTLPDLKSKFVASFSFWVSPLVHSIANPAQFQAYLSSRLIECDPRLFLLASIKFFVKEEILEAGVPIRVARIRPRLDFTAKNNECALILLQHINKLNEFIPSLSIKPRPHHVALCIKSILLNVIAANNIDGLEKVTSFFLQSKWMTPAQFNTNYLPIMAQIAAHFNHLSATKWIAAKIDPKMPLAPPTDFINKESNLIPNTKHHSFWDLLEITLCNQIKNITEKEVHEMDFEPMHIAMTFYQSTLSAQDKLLARKMLGRYFQRNSIMLIFCLESYSKSLSEILSNLEKPTEFILEWLQMNKVISQLEFHHRLLSCLVNSRFKFTDLLIELLQHKLLNPFYLVVFIMQKNQIPFHLDDQTASPLALLTKRFWSEKGAAESVQYWQFSQLFTQLFEQKWDAKTTLNSIAQSLAQTKPLPSNPAIDAPFMRDPIGDLMKHDFPVQQLFYLAIQHANRELFDDLLTRGFSFVLTNNTISLILNLSDNAFCLHLFAILSNEDLETLVFRAFLTKSSANMVSFLNRIQNRLPTLFPMNQFGFLHLACLLGKPEYFRLGMRLLPMDQRASRVHVNATLTLSCQMQKHLQTLKQMQFLMMPSNLNQLDCLNGLTAFDLTVILNQVENARTLATLQPNPYNIETQPHIHSLFQGHSLLSIAVSRGDAEIVKLLLSLGVDPLFAGTASATDCLTQACSPAIKSLLKAALMTYPTTNMLAHLHDQCFFPQNIRAVLQDKKWTIKKKISDILQIHTSWNETLREQNTTLQLIPQITQHFLTVRPRPGQNDGKLTELQNAVRHEIRSFEKLKILHCSMVLKDDLHTLEHCLERLNSLDLPAAKYLASAVQSVQGMRLEAPTNNLAHLVRELHTIHCITLLPLAKVADEFAAQNELKKNIEEKIRSLRNAHCALKKWLKSIDLMPSNPNTIQTATSSTASTVGFFSAELANPDVRAALAGSRLLRIYLATAPTDTNGNNPSPQ